MTIGLLSDTHNFLDEKVFHYFKDCDEIWHAGDFGTATISKQLQDFKPLRGVYGNIDGADIRKEFGKDLIFELEGFKIYMTHIGGYPGRYSPASLAIIKRECPQIFVCGHSHILKVITDKSNHNMIAINPGAAGKHGFQLVRTILMFDIEDTKISNMKVIELGTK